MNNEQREEYMEREKVIKQLQKERNTLAGDDLLQLIAYDIVINEYSIDQKTFWYFYYSYPTEKMIKREVEGTANTVFELGITEEDVKKEYAKNAKEADDGRRKLEILDEYFSQLIKDSDKSLYCKYCELRKKFPSPYHNNIKSEF